MKQISATHDCRTFSFGMCSNHEKTTHFGNLFHVRMRGRDSTHFLDDPY